jgi:NAD(P)-dependent dehydrogenase (short-subunit alcohol dehydrogenase family)
VPLITLPPAYRALVLGASGAIGAAFLAHLRADPRCGMAVGLSRHSDPPIDFDRPDSIAHAAQHLRALGPFHVIIVATGLLHGACGQPEKRLADVDPAYLATILRVNVIGPTLLLQAVIPLLARNERSLFALLSAKVGSIGDNRLGGWYGYRASKAALNMVIKTASIELARTLPQAVLVALHPGTVRSALSAPFRGGELGRDPALAAAEMISVLDSLSAADSGGFRAYDGSSLPW